MPVVPEEPEPGDVWLLRYAGEPTACEVRRVAPFAVEIYWLKWRWLTKEEFNERNIGCVGCYRPVCGWRRLFNKREFIPK